MDILKVSILLTIIVTQCVSIPVEEVLPERFLPPRDFNPHPYESGDFSGSGQGGNRDLTFAARTEGRTDPGVTVLGHEPTPYALLARKRPREGRYQHHREGEPIIYPHPVTVLRQIKKKPPTSSSLSSGRAENNVVFQNPDVRPYEGILYQPPTPIAEDQRIDSNAEEHYDQRHSHSTPLYAFSYLVKGDRPGDHYSHAQQHSESGTRGQYRVKLPDGRLQVVSYVADDSGYKAVVSYDVSGGSEDDNAAHSPLQLQAHIHSPGSSPVHSPVDSPVHSSIPAHSTVDDFTYKEASQHNLFNPSVLSTAGNLYSYGISSTPSPSFLVRQSASLVTPSPPLHYDSNEAPIEYSNFAPPRATLTPALQYPEEHGSISLLAASTPSPLHLHSRFISPLRLNRLLQQNVGSK